MDPPVNPFAVLSLIVAPAVLTNASSVLVMSTSNRLARAVDRARELSKQLEEAGALTSSEAVRRLRELAATEQRSLMLLVALRSFYVALGSFASAALVSLLGAVLVPMGAGGPVRVLEVGGVVADLLAVSALVHGSVVLVRETRPCRSCRSVRRASMREPCHKVTLRPNHGRHATACSLPAGLTLSSPCLCTGTVLPENLNMLSS